MQGRGDGMDVNLPPSGPFDLPRTQSPQVSSARSLPAFPAVPAGLEGSTKQCPPQRPSALAQRWTPSLMHLPVSASMSPCHLEASRGGQSLE